MFRTHTCGELRMANVGLAGNLADKSEGAILCKGVFHVFRHVRVPPPFGGAKEDAVGLFQIDFNGHNNIL